MSFVFKNWYYIIFYFKLENSHEWNTTFNFYQSKSFPRIKENKFCSERQWYNCWNPQISVKRNFNSLLHFVQEKNYQWWKQSPKGKTLYWFIKQPIYFPESCSLLGSNLTCFVLVQIPQFIFYGKLSSCWFKVRWLKFQRVHWSIPLTSTCFLFRFAVWKLCV